MPEATKKRRRQSKRANGHGFSDEVLDSLLKQVTAEGQLSTAEDMQGLLRQLSGALLNRAMEAEMTHHLGYERGEEPPEGQPNRRNGANTKQMRSDHGKLEMTVPRDRDGTFEPQLVPKHQRSFKGFDDKILSMYARGMTVRDIREQLEELYAVDVSTDLISRVTDGVLDELRGWQKRPLENLYYIVYLDALVVKIRDKGTVRNKVPTRQSASSARAA